MFVLFDVVGSLASRTLKFDYASLVWMSWGLYAAAGYLGFAFGRLPGGAIAGLVAGVADATIGWSFSTVIGPYIRSGHQQLTIFSVCAVIVMVAMVGAFFGLLGALTRLPFSGREKASGA
jgi:hypothetical protein